MVKFLARFVMFLAIIAALGCAAHPRLLFVETADGSLMEAFDSQPSQRDLAAQLNKSLGEQEKLATDAEAELRIYHSDGQGTPWRITLESLPTQSKTRHYNSGMELVSETTIIKQGFLIHRKYKSREDFCHEVATNLQNFISHAPAKYP